MLQPMESTTGKLMHLLTQLEAGANPVNVEGQRRFGITTQGLQLGLDSASLRALAKQHRRDHPLALALWSQAWHETRLLAPLIADPKRLTKEQMELWAADFDNWATCDNACIHCFRKSPLAFDCAREWTSRSETFVKRAGFALIASLAVHAKREPDTTFLALLPSIEREAWDERNFVKKAVNWALRQIGKRNESCRAEAMACARRILQQNSAPARWIARDALRELESRNRAKA